MLDLHVKTGALDVRFGFSGTVKILYDAAMARSPSVSPR
jgi:hypothetical protein